MNQTNRNLPEYLKKIFDEIDSMSDYFKELEQIKEKQNESTKTKKI